MTGFARAAGHHGAYRWTWEVRSVNSRALDLRVRLPSGYECLEPAVRRAVSTRIRRGAVSLTLEVVHVQGRTPLKVNRELLEHFIDLHEELGDRVARDAPRLEALLAVRGVVEPSIEEEDPAEVEARETTIMETLERALDALAEARRSEGERLAQVLRRHVDEIETLRTRAGAAAAARPEALKARLKAQIEEILDTAPALPEDRLVQEVAILVSKGDVREELDRIDAHIEAARELLREGVAIGRRLDFLCQELNREANTLCAKSGDAELTRIGLDLKAAIERLREQVQNVE